MLVLLGFRALVILLVLFVLVLLLGLAAPLLVLILLDVHALSTGAHGSCGSDWQGWGVSAVKACATLCTQGVTLQFRALRSNSLDL
eukprot:2811143-Lingulodinium_polyedra.AAC.1